MNYRLVLRYISKIMLIEALLMIPSVVISLFLREYAALEGFSIAIFAILFTYTIAWACTRHARSTFNAREGLICVGLSWIVLSFFGCIPFVVSGAIPSFVDAFFEIASGFTTTGASILTEVEPMDKGLLFWRSLSHWVGGMGVLVFLLALDPGKGHGQGFTMHIMRAESPGPDVGKLVPHIKDTAKLLYRMYLLLTVLDIVFLLIGGMPLFDSLCTAFGTAGTGGFGIKNDSLGSYSPYIQNVTTIFMILFGVNFSCYYLLFLKKFKSVFKDEEVRLYFGMILGSIVLIAYNIRGLYGSIGETIRHAAFQVGSVITTTGFSTVDFNEWPGFSKGILLCLMLVGACAGSTGGGLKCARFLILVKGLRRNMHQALCPHKVQVVRNNGKMINEKIIQNVNAYFAAYVLIMIASFLVISLDGFSIETNVSAVIACFNNIGPGFGDVGAASNYSAYSALSKIVLSFDMLAGRLEIFPIVVLFTRSAWVRK